MQRLSKEVQIQDNSSEQIGEARQIQGTVLARCL